MTKEQPKMATAQLVTQYCKDTMAPGLCGCTIDMKSMERKIQRWKNRALDYPKKPRSFADLESLPPKFTTSYDGDKFLLFNKVIGNSGAEVDATQEGTQASSSSAKPLSSGKAMRMIGYASNFGLHLLRQADTWSADGTFSVTPDPFYQLYTILAHLDGYAFPAAFVFMPGKNDTCTR
jgi:hypothetical protein